MPHESKLTFTREEILADVPTKEPLIVNGVRCHGGFDADGVYHSPRTLWRVPAIKAWQQRHLAKSGMPLFEIPAEVVPPQSPGVAQAKFLLRAGVREPMVRNLTEIAIVEGFGAMIRELPVPAISSFVREDTTGTALAHLAGGLFEAQARDEAGWSEEGGHRQMWEAARDAALSSPAISPQIFQDIIARRMPEPRQMFPQLDVNAERVVRVMVNVLVIEVMAAATFSWAEDVLSDPEVSDDPEKAANLVRYIRSDEAPHVEYLRTALSEIQARTLIGRDGYEVSGKEVVEALAERSLKGMLKQRFTERPAMLRDMIRKTANVKNVEELIAQVDALATPWTPPARFADLVPPVVQAN
ncbi:MAG TPA: hypothetical protein VMU16_01370 [Candidatus Binataceae bacterium]|nr:hypothetical protein [Candidatus Binataceae bacterium]